MRRVLKNVNNWWIFTFSTWILKNSSPGKFTRFNTLIGEDTCQLFQVFVCNKKVLESRQRSLRKSRLLWAYNCYLTVSQANSVNSLQLSWCLYFVLSFFSKFISMRDGLEEWTRENFLFMVGKRSRNTSFLSSPRQPLKTKLCRRSFQKPVPIVQNTY